MKALFLITFLTCLLAGCEENDFDQDFSGIKPVVLVPNSNWPGQSLYGPQPMDSIFGTTTLNLYARVSYEKPLGEAVKVVFKINPDILDTYNAKWFTSYSPLPEDAFQVSSLELTIPGGEQQAYLPITVFPEKISGSQDYLIAFTIQSAEDHIVAANAKTIVFTLKGQ